MTIDDLTEDQKKAFENIKTWVNDFGIESETYYTLSGKAGSGKTVLVNFIIQYFKNELKLDVVATATTNKAVKVLKEKIHNFYNFKTIHSLLNIKPVRQGSKEVFKPVDWNKSDITQYDVVIIDEASMISEELLEIIKAQTSTSEMKVLFVGDSAQLQPINEDTSKCFAYDGSQLNEIVRYGDIIANVADKVRNVNLDNVSFNDILHPPTIRNINVQEALEEFQAFKEDLNNIRLLCWTNARVHYWNKVLRTAHYGYEPKKPFIKGDTVLANDACEAHGRIVMMNKEEGVITGVDDQGEYYILEIKKEMGGTCYVNVIKDEFKTKLKKTLQEHAESKQWRKFWSLKKFYHDIRHCYAMTIHSSQGSTFKKVILHKNDIDKNRDPKNRNQLVYVGITRAEENVFLL